MRKGAKRLRRTVLDVSPAVTAVLGVTAYRTAFVEPRAVLGDQKTSIEGSDLWVIPNPSGLNAHETIGSLSDWLRNVAVAAGLD